MSYLIMSCLLLFTAAELHAQCACEPLGKQLSGDPIIVKTSGELRAAVSAAIPNREILVRSGRYYLSGPIEVTMPGVVVRSESGVRDSVVIEGGGFGGAEYGFIVRQGNFTLGDLTIVTFQNSGLLIQPSGATSNYRIHNVAVINSGPVALTARPNGHALADLTVECSYFGWDLRGSDKIGLLADSSVSMIVRDSRFVRVSSFDGSAAAIVAGPGTRDLLIERNMFIDCDKAMVIGDTTDAGGEVTGVTVRSNMIKGGNDNESGIVLSRVTDGSVTHNTIYSPQGRSNWSIELRYLPVGQVALIDNLADEPVAIRDGEDPIINGGNITNITAQSFRDASTGDLHLVAGSPAIDAALNPLSTDIDCQNVQGVAGDVGADEYSAPAGVDEPARMKDYHIAYDRGRGILSVTTERERSVDLELVDMAGRSIAANRATGAVQIPTAELPAGLYLLVIETGGVRNVEKISIGE